MYMVVSRWDFQPGRRDAFIESGSAVRSEIRKLPGVVRVDTFETEDGGAMAVVVYESRDSYDRLVNSPDGPFEKIAARHNIEADGKWQWSARGELLEDGPQA